MVSGLFLYSCSSSKSAFNHPESLNYLVSHKRVAILPFKVTFSEDYKKLILKGKTPWEEQQRVAGLDLQKAAYEDLAKRAHKKKFGFTVQDFLTTNKTLEQSGISFSTLMTADKARISDILGVDAVIFGNSDVNFELRNGYMGTNGIYTSLELYDAAAGEKIWSMTDKEYIRSQFDSPQDLARRSADDLIGALPYRSVSGK